MEYDNTNTGALFANRDRKGEKDPNAKGSINIEGVEYWISAWTNESKKGEKYQRLKVTKKDSEKPVAPAIAEDFDDDLPF